MGLKSYILETYTDEYKTLSQTIMIDEELDKQSNGLHAAELRRGVNPNLLYLIRRERVEMKGGESSELGTKN